MYHERKDVECLIIQMVFLWHLNDDTLLRNSALLFSEYSFFPGVSINI